MRKILLASSALVAGSAVAASALAAEAPTVSLSGGINVSYVAESSYKNSKTKDSPDEFKYIPSATELRWAINAQADNGMSYGGMVDWRPQSNALDEIWIHAAGSFGKIVLGDDDAVGDNTVPHAGSALVGSYGFDGSWVAGTSAGTVYGAIGYGPAGGMGDQTKISYYTPDFSGFSAGVSFTPQGNTGKATKMKNNIEAMVAYSGEMSGTSFTLAGQYRIADAASTGLREDPTDSASRILKRNDLSAWEIGGKASFSGFTVAAGFFDSGDSLTLKKYQSDPSAATNEYDEKSKATAGKGWDIGVGYSFGNAAVSLGYLDTTKKDNAGKKISYNNIAVDTQYTIAEGLTAYAGAQFAEGKTAAITGKKGKEDITTVIIGTKLSF